MINRRTKNAPSDEIIKKITNYFHLEPEYFYEYRLRRMLEKLDKNREFLDHCEKEFKKWNKTKKETLATDKEQDEATA